MFRDTAEPSSRPTIIIDFNAVLIYMEEGEGYDFKLNVNPYLIDLLRALGGKLKTCQIIIEHPKGALVGEAEERLHEFMALCKASGWNAQAVSFPRDPAGNINFDFDAEPAKHFGIKAKSTIAIGKTAKFLKSASQSIRNIIPCASEGELEKTDIAPLQVEIRARKFQKLVVLLDIDGSALPHISGVDDITNREIVALFRELRAAGITQIDARFLTARQRYSEYIAEREAQIKEKESELSDVQDADEEDIYLIEEVNEVDGKEVVVEKELSKAEYILLLKEEIKDLKQTLAETKEGTFTSEEEIVSAYKEHDIEITVGECAPFVDGGYPKDGFLNTLRYPDRVKAEWIERYAASLKPPPTGDNPLPIVYIDDRESEIAEARKRIVGLRKSNVLLFPIPALPEGGFQSTAVHKLNHMLDSILMRRVSLAQVGAAALEVTAHPGEGTAQAPISATHSAQQPAGPA